MMTQPVRYRFQSEAAEDFPSIIILENTTVCNLRCIHCPQGQGYPEREDDHAVYMDWDVYKKAIDEVEVAIEAVMGHGGLPAAPAPLPVGVATDHS